jgi:hypothetical protein
MQGRGDWINGHADFRAEEWEHCVASDTGPEFAKAVQAEAISEIVL